MDIQDSFLIGLVTLVKHYENYFTSRYFVYNLFSMATNRKMLLSKGRCTRNNIQPWQLPLSHLTCSSISKSSSNRERYLQLLPRLVLALLFRMVAILETKNAYK